MSTVVSTADHGHESGHAHPGQRQYLVIAAVLALITAIEVWIYTVEHPLVRAWMVTILLVLSAGKFVAVVGYFMHLRSDNRLFTYMFGFGMLIATSIIIALMLLFSATHPPVTPAPNPNYHGPGSSSYGAKTGP